MEAVRKREEELAGGYIPRELSEHLSLLAVVKRTTRSDIIRGLIADKLEAEKPPTRLIFILAKRALKAWANYGEIPGGGVSNFDDYLRSVASWLERRKVTKEHIDAICLKARKLHNENKTSTGPG